MGFLAAATILSAIVLAFYHNGPVVGFAFVTVAVVGLPITVALAFKYWPHTPMGRRFLLGLPTHEDVSPDDERQLELKELVGKVGTAVAWLRSYSSQQLAGGCSAIVRIGSRIWRGTL